MSPGDYVFYITVALIASGLGWATIAGRDCWPFSHYPMFAGRAEGNAVRYFALRFQRKDGSIADLQAIYSPLADRFHRDCERLSEDRADKLDSLAREHWQAAIRFDASVSELVAAIIEVRVAQVRVGGHVELTTTTLRKIAGSELEVRS